MTGPDFLGKHGFDVIVVSDVFEHVLGSRDEDGGSSCDARWRMDPASSPTFQSLARAIVARDGSLFEPGPSNLDWRLHAVSPVLDEGDRA